MKVKMKETKKGSPDGVLVFDYQKGKTYDPPERLANTFVRAGWATIVKPEKPKEKVEKLPETKDIEPPETKDEEPGEDKEPKEEAPPEPKDEELAKTDDGLEEPKVEKPPEPKKKDKN